MRVIPARRAAVLRRAGGWWWWLSLTIALALTARSYLYRDAAVINVARITGAPQVEFVRGWTYAGTLRVEVQVRYGITPPEYIPPGNEHLFESARFEPAVEGGYYWHRWLAERRPFQSSQGVAEIWGIGFPAFVLPLTLLIGRAAGSGLRWRRRRAQERHGFEILEPPGSG